MPTNPPKLTLHMVASLDGFIANKDNTVDWMHSTDSYPAGVTLTQEDVTEFLAGIDCYVMGSKTYEHALKLGWPYGEVPVIVLTNRNLPKGKESVELYAGDLETLVNTQLKSKYQNIWLVGGAMLAKAFLRAKLVDEIVLSILPIILGDGLLFFDYIRQEQRLHLKDAKAYTDGMVELHYEVLKEQA
ncbi:MAG: dihydrofolate reductase [Saprospiraceae bacterium]|nr:dihydrofolate reductase [Saprospiraceae bacterium]